MFVEFYDTDFMAWLKEQYVTSVTGNHFCHASRFYYERDAVEDVSTEQEVPCHLYVSGTEANLGTSKIA